MHARPYTISGVNVPSDYHVNETEEWFYQYKGGMLLRMIDDEMFKEYRIEEGEMFLLPGELAHSTFGTALTEFRKSQHTALSCAICRHGRDSDGTSTPRRQHRYDACFESFIFD